MKVLMLSPSYPRQADDYSGIFIKYLVDGLVSAGAAVHVLTASDRDNATSEFGDRLVVERVRYFWRPLEVLFYRPSGGIPQRLKSCSPALLLAPFFAGAYCLAVFRRARSCDLVHCHWLPTAALAWLPARCLGKRLVVSLRGSDMHNLRPAVLPRTQALLLRLADAVVSVNRDYCVRARQLLEESGVGTPIDYIPNGVSAGAPRTRAGDRIRRLLFIGNVLPEKGIPELAQAFAALRQEFPDLTLTLVGEVPANPDPVARQLMASAGVEALGMVAPPTVRELMGSHDLLVFPSHREGRPNVIIEAAACRLPMVATALPGVTEVFAPARHALLVPARDAEALRQAIAGLIRRPDEARRLAAAAFDRIRELGLTWENCARAHLDLYQRLV